ncbi:hypothetical protein RCJ22_19480, partial [Vibrio sp. FNV 38]|nr:hypothetical protein [Vibrio sp. FNV 38]
HIGGLPEILSGVSVGELILLRDDENSETFQNLLAVARNAGATIRYAQTGMRAIAGEGWELDVLYAQDMERDENESSLLFRLSYHKQKFLFLADAEARTERLLLENQISVEADWIKVGHHGSSTSSTEEFL